MSSAAHPTRGTHHPGRVFIRGPRELAAILAVTTFAVFLPCLANGWAEFQDDRINFLQNEAYRGLGLPQVLWAFRTFLLGVYQPLAWILLEAQYTVFGMAPSGYHFTSILLHAGNAAILTVLLAAILHRCPAPGAARDRLPIHASAALGALLFSVHPLRVETVAWASCQPYLPSAGLAMLATLAYLHRDGTHGLRRLVLLLAALLLYVAALLCKAVALPLPLVFLILDAFPLRRFSRATGSRWTTVRTAVLEKLPFVLVALFFLTLAVSAKYAGDPVNTTKGGGLANRLSLAGFTVFYYVEKSIWPANLSGLYEGPEGSWPMSLLLAGNLVTLCVTLAACALVRRWPGFLAAWLAYLVLVAPVSGLVRSASGLVADRYAYVPVIPLFGLLAFGFTRLPKLQPGKVRLNPASVPWLVATATVLMFAFHSARLCRTWRDSETVLNRARAAGAISSARYFTALATMRANSGRLDEAEAAYRAAVALQPALPSAATGLGLLLAVRGHREEGLAWIDQAIASDPNYFVAYYQKGMVLAERGKFEEAASQLSLALRLHPYYVDALLGLARVKQDQGKPAEAAEAYARALACDPGNRRAGLGLAAALEQGNFGRRSPGQL